MAILIIVALLITGAATILYEINQAANNKPVGMSGGPFLFVVGLALVLIVCFAMVEKAGTQIQSTKPIKPTLKINCTNSKCDTIYIYQEPGDNS